MAFKDIIVAVHGIGSQSRFSTVRSVASQLANSAALSGTGGLRPVSPQPLGYFHSDVKSVTSVQLLDDAESLKDSNLKSVGFAEVFWADIPQEVANEGRTLEETKAWASTVVARARALCERTQKEDAKDVASKKDGAEKGDVSKKDNASKKDRPSIVPPDFSLAGEVLDEIIETVYVLENLTYLAEKAGVFKFDLRKVLEEYLGDVQLVAEFSYYRTDVVGRFHEAMTSISEQHPNARLHIVAHSEGTVVSFLGLLHAMCARKVLPADGKDHDATIEGRPELPKWLKQVHGFMTIGSPIDKHLLLWRRLWGNFDPSLFSGADILDLDSLVTKLQDPSNAVSKYLSRHLPSDLSDFLADPKLTPEEKAKDTKVKAQKLADELNRIIQGPPKSLYQDSMEDGVSPFTAVLSPEAKELVAKKPTTGPSLLRLNRILLEKAYSEEIGPRESLAPGQIRWRNYYDFGDPVGFKLDSARLWLQKMEIRAFEFCGCEACHHDIGFARYLLPGAAHNEYWSDSEVFEHFIGTVVKKPFSVSDLKDFPSLLKKLQGDPVDSVSKYVSDRISKNSNNVLTKLDPTAQDLVDELNGIVQSPPPSLYDDSATKAGGSPVFTKVSPETKKLLARGPIGPSLVAVNRSLLEEAYPAEIAKNAEKVPATKRYVAVLSNALPFLISFVILLLGVFILFKAVYAYSHPSLDPLQKFMRFQELGVNPPETVHGWGLFATVLGIAGLITGATLLTRFRRLAPGNGWVVAGFAALLVGFGCYAALVPHGIRAEIGSRFWYMAQHNLLRPWVPGRWAPTIGVLAVTSLAALSGFLVMSRTWGHTDRRQRWFLRGTRPIMICGGVAIGLIILGQLYPQKMRGLYVGRQRVVEFTPDQSELINRTRLTTDELWQLIGRNPTNWNNPTNWVKAVRKVEPLLVNDPPVWPVMLSGAAFLYLWWLAILIFDLSFVWRRYIRNSITNDRLRDWNPYGFPPRNPEKPELCCNPFSGKPPGSDNLRGLGAADN